MATITLQTFDIEPGLAISATSVTLRFWYSTSFIDSDGQFVGGGTSTSGNQIRAACTVTNGIITVPATEIFSTLDAQTDFAQAIQFNCQVFKGNTALNIFPFNQSGTPSSWFVPNPSPATTISFESLSLLNQNTNLAYPPQTYPTTQEMINYVNSIELSGVTVDVNAVAVGQRPTINFIPGANVGITGVDNSGSDRIDLTINAVGGGGGATFANPTALIGLSTINGSAITAIRSDAASALDQGIVPTWTGIHTFQAVPLFAPTSAIAPFTLSASGQGQTVVGLKADQLDKILTAGDGLTGGGLLTANRTVTLGTPSTLTVATSNSVSGTTHAHAITTSSNPGAAASILATDSSGQLTLVNLLATSNVFIRDTSTGFTSPGTTVVSPVANNAIRSTNYTSGLVGWNVSAVGNAEFANVDVRGAIRSAVFVYNQLMATSGTLGVFKAAAKLKTDVTIPVGPTYGTTTVNIDVVDQDGVSHAASQLFAVGDVLRMKDGLTGDTWFTVASVSDQTTFWRYVATIRAGSANVTYQAGLAVADYGAANSGFIILTADQTNAPYMQMATQAATFSSADASGVLNVTPQLRIGNLNGSYGYATDIYGFGAGQFGTASKEWITVDQTNGFRIGTNTTVLGQWDTTGAITVGQVAASQPNITLDSTNGIRMRINTTVVGQWTTLGNLNIGETGAGKSFLQIESGSLAFRNDAIERVKLTSAGVLTINDGAGAAVITLDASTGAEITKKLTMPGASSAIAIGSTPPTSATVGTGIWIDRTGIFGLASNVQQATFSATTGKITAGAGDVTLDVDGIKIAVGTSSPNRINWMSGADVLGYMVTSYGSNITGGSFNIFGKDTASTDTIMSFTANDWVGGSSRAELQLRITGPLATPAKNAWITMGDGGSGVTVFRGLLLGGDGNITGFGTDAQNVISFENGVAPSTSPTGRGQLYVESGALKFRGSSGTITTLAIA